MKKMLAGILTFIVISATFVAPVFAVESETASAFEPLDEKPAYQRYIQRPKSEFSKLVYLLELFENSENQVIVDGRSFGSTDASPIAKQYLRRHYNGKQKAASWIKNHCYRTVGGNQIIRFQFTDGVTKPLRDVLLTELSHIEAKLP